MLYRFTKKIHKITAFAGILLWIGAVGESDFHTLAMRQSEPETVGTLIAWGFALMIPTAIHLILEYARGKKNAVHR